MKVCDRCINVGAPTESMEIDVDIEGEERMRKYMDICATCKTAVLKAFKEALEVIPSQGHGSR